MLLHYPGNDPAELDADPYWALTRAAGRGDLDALKLFISERRSDPTSSHSTADLELPLESSARDCNLELVSSIFTDETLVRWFLDNGVDVATVSGTSQSLTPVTYAANCATTSVVSLLLSHGATFNHRVLHNATRGHGDDDVAAFTMFDFLLQHDPLLAQAINDIDNLHHPSRTRIERMKLDYGTPLHWAVLKGRKVRVEFLISRGADAKAKTPKKNLTPADWAKILGNQELIDYFSALET
ncbi:MAG: hypothetical protein Q9210_000665 [Variospora velana]